MAQDALHDQGPTDGPLSFERFLVGLQDPETQACRAEVCGFLELSLELLQRNLAGQYPRKRRDPFPTIKELLDEAASRGLKDLTKGKLQQFWGLEPIRIHRDTTIYGLVAKRPWGVTEKAAHNLIQGAEKVARGEEEFEKVILRVTRMVDGYRSKTAPTFLLQFVPLVDQRFQEAVQDIHREIYRRGFGLWLSTMKRVAEILHLDVGESELHDLCKILTGLEDASVLSVVRNDDRSYFDATSGKPLLYVAFIYIFSSVLDVSKGVRIEDRIKEHLRWSRPE